MKKLTRILSLIIFLSIGVTRPISQDMAALGGITLTALITHLVYVELRQEQKRVEHSRCSPVNEEDGEDIRDSYESDFFNSNPELTAIVAGIVGGYVAYKILLPMPKKA